MFIKNSSKENINEEELSYYQSVIVLCAGGTINMTGLSECKPGYGVATALQDIESSIGKENISIIYENLFKRAPDSTNIGETEWEIILKRVKEITLQKESIKRKMIHSGIHLENGGIIVAHGTDTLHITSFVIALEMSLENIILPIIFTASHSTIDKNGSDAKENLKKSIYLAKEQFNRECNLLPGVYVLIGQDIHLASRLTKVSTEPNIDNKYFLSFPSPIGKIEDDTFHFTINNNYIKESMKLNHMENDYFILEKRWGIVEHVFIDKHANLDILNDLCKRIYYYRSLKELENREIGVIIQGDFKNNEHFNELIQMLQQLDEDEVITFIGSKQTFMKAKEKGSFHYLGLIPKSLTHLKAKIKLGWLLRSTLSKDKIMEAMCINFVGEIFKTDVLPDWINFETFHNYESGTEIILAYPNISPKVLEDAVNRLEKSSSKQKKIYLYGFGDGHIPTTNKSISDIVTEYLHHILTRSDFSIKQGLLSEIITEICMIIQMNRESIEQHFIKNHSLNLYALEKEITQSIIKRFILNQKIMLDNNCISLNPQKIINDDGSTNKKIKFDNQLIKEEKNKLKKKCNDFSDIENSIKLLIDNFPEVIALRILKDSIMSSNKNMEIIGKAIDYNIKVFVKTFAVKSQTDISKYEVGNMLMILGVNSDKSKGYKSKVFRQNYSL